jgi:hypothetical protein
MRLIRLVPPPTARRRPLVMAALMLAVGATAAVLAIAAPGRRPEANAALAIVAALGLGVGAGMLGQTLRIRHDDAGEDIVRLLSPTLDDTYLLLLRPRLPGVSRDLEALLVGPAGVRAVVARRWQGRYRVRGHGWEFDTRGKRGWIPCITNPSFESGEVRIAVADWARSTLGDGNLPVEPAIAFPSRLSRIVLEEPDIEVITSENAPWWANRMGRFQRMDAARVVQFAEAVVTASRRQAEGSQRPKAPPRPGPSRAAGA